MIDGLNIKKDVTSLPLLVHFGYEKALEKFHFNDAFLFQKVNKFPKLCIRADLTCKNFTNLYCTIKSTYRQLFQRVMSLFLLFATFALPGGKYIP